MPATSTTYTGINRTVSDFLPSGACEELVNLRPTDTGLRPVNPHKRLATGVNFTHYWTHRIGVTIKRIARIPTTGGFNYCVVSDDGTVERVLLFVPANADDHFAILGNMVVISCKGTQQTYVFRFVEGDYKAVTAETPTVNPSFSATDAELVTVKGASINKDTPDIEIREYIASGNNHIQEENKDLCFGTVLVALSWHTKDGEDYNTFYWKRVNAAADANFEKAQESTVQGTDNKYYYDSEQNAFLALVWWWDGSQGDRARISLVGSKLTMTIPGVSGIDTDTTMLESLNVWVSRPMLPYDPAEATIIRYQRVGGYDCTIHMLPTPFADNEPGKQLLYLQKRIPIADLVKGQYTLEFEFGGNLQTTNKTLEVDGGILTRYGKMLQYNSRLHYYDSVVKRGVWTYGGIFTADPSSLGSYVYLTVQEDGAEKIINIPGSFSLAEGMALTDAIIPNLKATRLWMQKVSDLSDIKYVNLTPSERYNYAHAFGADIETTTDGTALATARQNTRRDYILENEYQDLNVTEQMNPFVFDVDHSYRFPGRILDVQTQIVQASDVAFGVEPLNVFTDAGTYALSQGTGTTLYGNINIVNNLVSEGNSVSTKYGTFMLAAGGLWLIAGRHTTLVSEALREGPHRDICLNDDYITLTESDDLYHIEDEVPPVGDVPFRSYVVGASLSFDPFEEVLMVSNRNFKYSYALSLKYRQWYKYSGILTQSGSGDTVILEHTTLSIDITSASAEIEVLSVDPEAVSQSATMMIGSWMGSWTVEGQTTEQMALDIATMVNSSTACPATATANGNTVILAAKTAGAEGNALTISVTTLVDGVIELSIKPFSGGGTSFINDTMSVIDLSEPGEGLVKVHLQTRPLSPGQYMYTHIHRAVQMVRSALGNTCNLTVSLYGSDDLKEWVLLSCAQRTNVNVSQIRTNPAPNSWRYYTIVVGGIVHRDTDFGPVLMDFTQSVRRIG